MNAAVTLDPDELNPTDRAILEMLQKGRCTIAYIAEEHGYTRGNVGNQMRRLAEHGHVRRVHKGLYELVEDPRDK